MYPLKDSDRRDVADFRALEDSDIPSPSDIATTGGEREKDAGMQAD